jgi:hypoxanthine phosphoribosyltransferase
MDRTGQHEAGGTRVTHPDIAEVLFTEEQIQERVRELGAEISRDYEGRTVLLIAVLRGAALFLADLSRAITVPVELDFMAVSSYGSSTKSSGVVRILKDLDEQIEGRDVLVVEDILDTEQGRQAAGTYLVRVRGLLDPGRVRRRLRPRLLGAVP